MNKKIAIILTLMMTATTLLVGCESTAKNDKSDSQEVADTAFEVSSLYDENDNTDSANESEKEEAKETIKQEPVATDYKKIEDKTTKKNETKTNTTSNQQPKEQKPNTGKPQIFTAKAGYKLTIPGDWESKYYIEDKGDILNVMYKCSKDKTTPNAWIFSIKKEDGEEVYNSLWENSCFKVGNITYWIVGPTDIGLSEKSPDFDDYQAIKKQLNEVVESITVIK